MTNEKDDQFTRALVNAWGEWPEIKHTVVDYGFGDWCKRVNGFEFTRDRSTRGNAVLTKVCDEKKFVWFLLKWA